MPLGLLLRGLHEIPGSAVVVGCQAQDDCLLGRNRAVDKASGAIFVDRFMNPLRLKTIAHFFEHYKDLEEGKWVKILGWEGPDAARNEILDGVAAYQSALGRTGFAPTA